MTQYDPNIPILKIHIFLSLTAVAEAQEITSIGPGMYVACYNTSIAGW